MSDGTHHSFTFNGNTNFNGAIGCVFGPSNRVTISSLNTNTTSVPMPSEINNTFTFNGDSAAIGCAIGSTQTTITNSNDTTGVQKPTGWQSDGVRNALETNDGPQVVNDGRRLGYNDENGSAIVTESGRDGPGDAPDDGGNEDDEMSVDQDHSRNTYTGKTDRGAHILSDASHVNISRAEFNSIAGNSSKTTNNYYRVGNLTQKIELRDRRLLAEPWSFDWRRSFGI
ncbi:hypothetical protein F5887DRAFT_1073801 [Amanita rubescens]|nr:hypothetical protein F5887DRAFT_1073801 [Amanita rubescens]